MIQGLGIMVNGFWFACGCLVWGFGFDFGIWGSVYDLGIRDYGKWSVLYGSGSGV